MSAFEPVLPLKDRTRPAALLKSSPEEFRAPQAYESLGGTKPRRAGLGLWAFGILADAGSGAAIAAACPTSCFVPVSVRGVPVLRAAMVADSER
jgi:hypothetical protein